MLPALYDDDRRALARLAAMLVAGALCVLPLTTQNSSVAGAADVRDVANDPNIAPPARLTFPAYEVSRDPFVPEGSVRARLDGAAVPMSVGQSGDIGVVLPASASGGQGTVPSFLPASLAMGPVVRAIVLGKPPQALIEAGGTVHVLGVGDRLGELTVLGITQGRVTLSDGSILLLDGTRK